jgi:hypothetical protein
LIGCTPISRHVFTQGTIFGIIDMNTSESIAFTHIEKEAQYAYKPSHGFRWSTVFAIMAMYRSQDTAHTYRMRWNMLKYQDMDVNGSLSPQLWLNIHLHPLPGYDE